MKVEFVTRENGPERLVCEAEVHFEEPFLVGLKLVGFCLWKGADDEVYVTFPARAFGQGSDRRYFDYLRAVNIDSGGGVAARGFKDAILTLYRAWKVTQGEGQMAEEDKQDLVALAKRAQGGKR